MVAIILIIAAIAIPNLLRSKMSANEAAAVSVIRNVHNWQAVYIVEYTSCGWLRELPDQAGPWRSLFQGVSVPYGSVGGLCSGAVSQERLPVLYEFHIRS